MATQQPRECNISNISVVRILSDPLINMDNEKEFVHVIGPIIFIYINNQFIDIPLLWLPQDNSFVMLLSLTYPFIESKVSLLGLMYKSMY